MAINPVEEIDLLQKKQKRKRIERHTGRVALWGLIVAARRESWFPKLHARIEESLPALYMIERLESTARALTPEQWQLSEEG